MPPRPSSASTAYPGTARAPAGGGSAAGACGRVLPSAGAGASGGGKVGPFASPSGGGRVRSPSDPPPVLVAAGSGAWVRVGSGGGTGAAPAAIGAPRSYPGG